MTCNYKITPIDIPNDPILWLIEFDNDQKSAVHNVRRRTLIEEKKIGQKKVVHEDIFFETLKVVTVGK